MEASSLSTLENTPSLSIVGVRILQRSLLIKKIIFRRGKEPGLPVRPAPGAEAGAEAVVIKAGARLIPSQPARLVFS